MSHTPTPVPSPQLPPLPAEKKTDPSISAIKAKLHNELNWQGAKLTIAMIVVAVGTAFGAYEFILSEARAQTDGGLKVHESRIVAVEQQVPQLRQEVYEGRQDTRALQEVVLTGVRSTRLTEPLPPPPPPKRLDAGSP